MVDFSEVRTESEADRREAHRVQPQCGRGGERLPEDGAPRYGGEKPRIRGQLIEDATRAPATAPDQQMAPAPDQMPADETPVAPPAVAPDEPMGDPPMALFDEALARISLSMAARRLELPSEPTNDLQPAIESQPTWSASTLAGTAVIAIGGYKVLIGRDDRIKRRWMPGRFA
jgi:hypothetical protein